jgi:RNA polymerase sigma-70 factor (ECF subfamily)
MTLDALARDDGGLMAAVTAGRPEAFGELFDRYGDRAYRVALSVCRDSDRAQDAVQEGFLSVWKSRDSYRPEHGTVAAWLLTVVRHRAIDVARSSGRHSARRDSDDQLEARAAPSDVGESVIMRDDADRLRASLATLPDAQAEVITLAFYGQLSHTEIAAQLGLPAGTVKGRMRLGLQRLRVGLDRASV